MCCSIVLKNLNDLKESIEAIDQQQNNQGELIKVHSSEISELTEKLKVLQSLIDTLITQLNDIVEG